MQGRGVGRLMTAFIREYAERHRFASIRLDAYSGNPAAVTMYRRMGFREAGQVSFPRRELPFVLFEQEMSSIGG
jgi:ribosomal protein S18 acetylase RimI-like enzyme